MILEKKKQRVRLDQSVNPIDQGNISLDALTKLPDRHHFMQRLENIDQIELHAYHLLLVININGFKRINATRGNKDGDEILQIIAKRLSRYVSKLKYPLPHTIARLGGNEFGLILALNYIDKEKSIIEADMIAKSVQSLITEQYALCRNTQEGYARECYISCTIGMSVVSSKHKLPWQVYDLIESKMHECKNNKSLNLIICVTDSDVHIKKDGASDITESQLHKALHHNQFELFYQPQVDACGRVIGAEALIRLIDTSGSVIEPGRFILLAEDTGHIVPIGKWVIREGCRQLKKWESQSKHLKLAINVSARQLKQESFLSEFMHELFSAQIKPNSLKIELTESSFLDGDADVLHTLNTINNLGVLISLDDFGTGHSTFSLIKNIPINQFKIDQSFLTGDLFDPLNKNASIVRSIIRISKDLRTDVIAEGVETREQRRFLIENGCDMFQGYLYSKPLRIDEFNLFMDQYNMLHEIKQAIQYIQSEDCFPIEP